MNLAPLVTERKSVDRTTVSPLLLLFFCFTYSFPSFLLLGAHYSAANYGRVGIHVPGPRAPVDTAAWRPPAVCEHSSLSSSFSSYLFISNSSSFTLLESMIISRRPQTTWINQSQFSKEHRRSSSQSALSSLKSSLLYSSFFSSLASSCVDWPYLYIRSCVI